MPKLIRRNITPVAKVITPTDAVNETLRVTGLIPEQVLLLSTDLRSRYQTLKLKHQLIRRNLYRLKIGNPFLSDEEVDRILVAESETPLLRLGIPQTELMSQSDIDRLSGLYSAVSNWHAALGSPNIMPMTDALVRTNPHAAAIQLKYGYGSAMNMLESPLYLIGGEATGVKAAAKTAAQAAWKTTTPIVQRTASAIGQGAKAGGRAIIDNAPRVFTYTAANLFPAALAANTTYSDDYQLENLTNVIPWIIGGSLLFTAGRFTTNKWKWANPYSKYFRFWEKDPQMVMNDIRNKNLITRYNNALQNGTQKELDALKTELGKSPVETITQGKGKKAKTIPNPDYVSNDALGRMIELRAYPPIGNLITTKSLTRWKNFRNWGLRLPTYVAIPGAIIGLMSTGSLPTTYSPSYPITDADTNTPVDTVPAVVTSDIVPIEVPRRYTWSEDQ